MDQKFKTSNLQHCTFDSTSILFILLHKRFRGWKVCYQVSILWNYTSFYYYYIYIFFRGSNQQWIIYCTVGCNCSRYSIVQMMQWRKAISQQSNIMDGIEAGWYQQHGMGTKYTCTVLTRKITTLWKSCGPLSSHIAFGIYYLFTFPSSFLSLSWLWMQLLEYPGANSWWCHPPLSSCWWQQPRRIPGQE